MHRREPVKKSISLSRFAMAASFALLAAQACFVQALEKSLCADAETPGPYTTIALIQKRSQLSAADFSTYWRDIHGMLASRIPGFWSYSQNHLREELLELRHAGKNGDAPIDVVNGIAEVTFCTQADIAGLAGSPVAEMIKLDEQNAFAATYLYSAVSGDSLTLLKAKQAAPMVDMNPDGAVFALLKKDPAENAQGFRQSLLSGLAALNKACPDLVASRAHFFQPYNAQAWPAPNVNHSPLQVLDAGVELRFANAGSALACLRATHPFARSEKSGHDGRVVSVYSVAQRYRPVIGGEPSLLGLRGLPALELIEKLGASNQMSKPLLDTLFVAPK